MRLVSPSRVRPKDRISTQTDKAASAAPFTIPAPVRGWVETTPLTQPSASARIMENMFPTATSIRVRGGATKAATVGARCRSMFVYQTAAVSKLFAATATAVYDISGFNPTTVPSAAISGLTSGYFATEQMGTSGGEFMYVVNGTDSARLFDGSSWTTITGVSTPAITGVTTSDLSFVWKHKSRLWFVKKNSRSAYYLPVDSVGGAATEFPLAGVFQKGGTLSFGVTWSEDAGDGMDDRIVFVSSEGEVAVYQGTNPASDFALVGLYSMAPPRGPKCNIKAGGDVIIGTDDGAVPLSAVVSKDPAALNAAAVSFAIEQSWRKESRIWDGQQPWEMVKWPRENLLLATLPHRTNVCFVANIQTGAWTKYTGWDCQCVAVFNKQLYFADRSGFIFSAETGGSDNGAPYVAKVSTAPVDLGGGATIKSAGLMRATLQAAGTPIAQLSLAANYSAEFPALPMATTPPSGSGALWDAGQWDVVKWDDDGSGEVASKPVVVTPWTSVGAIGFAVAPRMQIVVSGTGRPNIELVQFDIMSEPGAAVV